MADIMKDVTYMAKYPLCNPASCSERLLSFATTMIDAFRTNKLRMMVWFPEIPLIRSLGKPTNFR